jgi:threonine/homoserine/homoserine lactone efflux protein
VFSLPIGILVGIVLAIAPGPVAVGAMKLSMSKGEREGVLFSLGSGLMDFFFCTFAIFATTAVVSALGSFSTYHPIAIFTIQALIVLGIILYGFLQFKEAKKQREIDNIDEIERSGNKVVELLKSKGAFAIGVAVALTNIASPTFLPSLGYVTMNIQKFGLYEVTYLNNFLLAFGFGLGNFLWLYLIVRIITHYKNKFSESFIGAMHKFAGYTLIGFGTFLGYRVIAFTKWPEIVGMLFAF